MRPPTKSNASGMLYLLGLFVVVTVGYATFMALRGLARMLRKRRNPL